MRAAWIVLTLGVALAFAVVAFAPGAAGSGDTIRTTFAGTCTLKNVNNSIGTTLYSIITCDAASTCACRGATKLAYHTESKYPATSAGGREQGHLTATSSEGSVILSLSGKRESSTKGAGTWTLGKISGYAAIDFRKRGTYAVATKELSQVPGTTSTRVRITATLACWYCP